jgi:hypothetical protein
MLKRNQYDTYLQLRYRKTNTTKEAWMYTK